MLSFTKGRGVGGVPCLLKKLLAFTLRPFQRQMVTAVKKGIPPDMSLGARAKQRTKHNTYMVVPVVFIMISNHFPVTTYGNQYNWAVLSALVLVGWGVAWFIRSR